MAIRDQMAANAAPLLKPDEKIQAVFGAQTVSQYLSLISYWIIIVKNAYRVVVVTDQRILVCRSGRFRTTPVNEVLAELPRTTRHRAASRRIPRARVGHYSGQGARQDAARGVAHVPASSTDARGGP